jgi:hypothetical protein
VTLPPLGQAYARLPTFNGYDSSTGAPLSPGVSNLPSLRHKGITIAFPLCLSTSPVTRIVRLNGTNELMLPSLCPCGKYCRYRFIGLDGLHVMAEGEILPMPIIESQSATTCTVFTDLSIGSLILLCYILNAKITHVFVYSVNNFV